MPELMEVGEQWAPADFLISEHVHQVWEFYFQVGGESEWNAGGKSYALRPGSFFAMAPGVLHRMRERPMARHHFLFATIDLRRAFGRQNALRDSWRGREIVFEPRGEALQAPFRQLIREVSALLPHRTPGIRAALDCLLIEATRLLESKRDAISFAANHPATARAREMLDHHPARKWKMADLARLTGLSPSRLSECFARDTGMSPHQYLLRARIERAKEALMQSDVTVTDLALDLGFSSSQHFAVIFKRLVGVPALAFRKHATNAR
ncbi:MAG: AraC family transcriptional regulator [Terrimicrobiaceae bacterium]